MCCVSAYIFVSCMKSGLCVCVREIIWCNFVRMPLMLILKTLGSLSIQESSWDIYDSSVGGLGALGRSCLVLVSCFCLFLFPTLLGVASSFYFKVFWCRGGGRAPVVGASSMVGSPFCFMVYLSLGTCWHCGHLGHTFGRCSPPRNLDPHFLWLIVFLCACGIM